MMTPNLGLPEIMQNQSAKEITHNQALHIIDVLLPIAVVQTRILTVPPKMIAGNIYIVPTHATKQWHNQENNLAYTDGVSWYFIAPKNKWPTYVMDENLQYRFNGETWEPDLPTAYDLGNLSGEVNIDLKNGQFQYGVLVGDVSFSLINRLPDGYMSKITLELKQDKTGKHEVTFGEEFKFYNKRQSELSLEPDVENIVMMYIRNSKK